MVGSIHLFTGCMFAGKTTKLMTTALSHDEDDILVIKHSSDNRYGTGSLLHTHSSRSIPCILANMLSDVLNHVKYINSTHIFIDEGQFFEDLVQFCNLACDRDGKHIYVAALNGDSNRQPFASVASLMSIVDTNVIMYAKCDHCCEEKALFSYRTETKGSAIGSSNKYIALCRHHYNSACNI